VPRYWVYILASKPQGTLHIGVTNGLIRRIDEQRDGKASSFTRKYKVSMLVWFQEYGDVRQSIQREKTMKEWPRAWKINRIERENPHWIDFYHSLPGIRPAAIKGAPGEVDRGAKPRDDKHTSRADP
jgi:putative endonuclease